MKILKKLKINKTILNNRICVSPMCQYSAVKGNPTNWHYNHLGKLMKAGAGMLMIESTAVSKQGMITEKDLSLFNKENYLSFKKLIIFLKENQTRK